MNTPLARWLAANRETLLPRWQALLEEQPLLAGAKHNGHMSHGAPVAHPDARAVLLASIYDGLISAADADHAPLDECLRMLRALRTHPGEEELPQQLGLVFRFRRAALALLFQDRHTRASRKAAAEWSGLLDDLDRLIEYASFTLANLWTTAAEVVRRELTETKMLVESLYHDVEATDRTTIQISNLNQIAQGLAASRDQAQQLQIVGEQLMSALAVATLTIWLFDPSDRTLFAARSWGTGVESDDRHAARITADDPDDLVGRAFQLGETVVQAEVDAARQGPWYQPGCVVLAAPLLVQRQAIGVIAILDPAPEGLLDRSQQDFVKSAASQAAIALENTRLYDEILSFNTVLEQRIADRTRELQMERDTLETLHEIALETSSTLDRDSLLEVSLAALARLVGVQHGSIMLVEEDTEHLIDCAVLGRTGTIGYTRFAMGQGIVGWVAQHKKPAIVSDVSQDPRWVALPASDEQRKTSGSMIAVPLIAHHETLGVLLLSHENVGYFNEDHLRLLSASAGQIAIGINNAQLYTELEKELLHRSEMLGRQEAEASQSQAILQSLSDGVIVCSEDGSVLTANLAVARILNRPIEELVIWNLPELLRRLLGRRAGEMPIEELLAGATDERRGPRTFSTTIELGTRIISVTLGPVLTSRDTLMGAVAVFRDITREVESDRLKTEFIGRSRASPSCWRWAASGPSTRRRKSSWRSSRPTPSA